MWWNSRRKQNSSQERSIRFQLESRKRSTKCCCSLMQIACRRVNSGFRRCRTRMMKKQKSYSGTAPIIRSRVFLTNSSGSRLFTLQCNISPTHSQECRIWELEEIFLTRKDCFFETKDSPPSIIFRAEMTISSLIKWQRERTLL